MNHVISLQFNLKELSIMKSFIEVFGRLFISLEFKITEFISKVMFGEAAVKEYEDLKLPSEDRPKEKAELKPKSRLKKRRNIQLHLLFIHALKRALFKMVLAMEAVFTALSTLSKRRANSFENTYR